MNRRPWAPALTIVLLWSIHQGLAHAVAHYEPISVFMASAGMDRPGLALLCFALLASRIVAIFSTAPLLLLTVVQGWRSLHSSPARTNADDTAPSGLLRLQTRRAGQG